MWQNTKSVFLRQRLFAAGALSAALHAGLIFGVAAPLPPGGEPLPAVEVRFAQIADAVATAPASATLAQPRQTVALDARPSGAVLLAAPQAQVVLAVGAEPAPASHREQQAAPAILASSIPEPEQAPVIEPGLYVASGVDDRARPLVPVEPVYPQAAQARGVSGKVVLLLLVDEMGAVSEAKVVAAEPQGYFEDSALAAFRSAPFIPAQKSGKPVKSRMLLQVRYEQENSRQVR